MSTGSTEDQRRRDLDDELEEGECSPGGYQSSSDTEDYYNRDAAAFSSGESEETVSDDLDPTASSAAGTREGASEAANRKGGATACSVLADLYGSGGAYSVSANRYGSARPSFAAASHHGRASASSSAMANHYGRAGASSAFAIACRVCGKEFSSEKAVCGHMKVHALEAAHGGSKEKGNGGKAKKVKTRNVEVAGGWGVTGRRGCSGLGTSMMDIVKDSPNDEPEHPAVMDTVPAEPELVYKPTARSFAMPENSPPASVASARASLSNESSSSKKPVHNDDMDIAEAAGASPDPIPPPDEPVVHQQQHAPPPARKQARLAHYNRQNPAGYRCADPACRMWFSNHQALGGHVAAHKNNKRAAAAAAVGMHQDGAAPFPKPEKRHPCNKCPAVFDTGVQLGGHMRKHWKGDPIAPRKKQRLSLIPPLPQPVTVTAGSALHLSADVFTLALPIKPESQSLALAPGVDAAQPAPAAAAAEGTPEPAPRPSTTGRVILFGIDIGLGVQTPPAQEGSPATKDSSASTDGEQQQ